MDDFLLSYLATESLVLELNQTRQLDYDMVARYATQHNTVYSRGREQEAMPFHVRIGVGVKAL